ncbi:hypothetical protein Scep_000980 [Stephania cephalantha]|uniref:Uncharacterized protein n=1 Tax=Stephania cephalantha TaxID=152367 RepID=A0AAP0Q4M0_9MAGN
MNLFQSSEQSLVKFVCSTLFLNPEVITLNVLLANSNKQGEVTKFSDIFLH